MIRTSKQIISIPLIVVITICFPFLVNECFAENLKRITNLEGTWKFTIGDAPEWSDPDYDDREWDYVQVPRNWEANGFEKYNGYAWYRKSFYVNQETDSEFLILLAGYIDDVDEVYINGHLVGTSGIFPPLVVTAYNILRKYPVPVDILDPFGKNVIAVRVFDDYHYGGIWQGPLGLYFDEDYNYIEQDLSGYWYFEAENQYHNNRAHNSANKSETIFVPGQWEVQGFLQLDGYATYEKQFKLDNHLYIHDDLMLVLGYIDDMDRVYINGKKIGSVEDLTRDKSIYYRTFRGYRIPEGLLEQGGNNTIVIKVYDQWGLGGIYAGPIGITTQKNFKALKERQKEPQNSFWYDFFKSFWE